MPKYLISWDAGFGETFGVVEFDNHEEALYAAYINWKDEVDSNANYDAKKLTPELAEEHGFADELEEDE